MRPSHRIPLNAARAFEAAARLGSMTAAAAELGVTHGAISRQIKALEQHVGLSLLQRLPRGLIPSAEGAALAAELSEAFDRVRSALSRVQKQPLMLSCSATIMMFWLLPRLGGFKRQHPAIELRLDVSYSEVDFLRDEVSVAIRNSMYQAPVTASVDVLAAEQIGAVCHPTYADRLGLRSIEDLSRTTLLATATRPHAWREWANAMGVPGLPAPPHETFEHHYLMVQAASCGLGLGIVPRMLVEGQIAAGQLVAPLGFVMGPHSLELWVAEHLRERADVNALASWLRAEMQGSSYRPAEVQSS